MYPGLFVQLTCVLMWITASITQYCVMMKAHAGKIPTSYYQWRRGSRSNYVISCLWHSVAGKRVLRNNCRTCAIMPPRALGNCARRWSQVGPLGTPVHRTRGSSCYGRSDASLPPLSGSDRQLAHYPLCSVARRGSLARSVVP